MLRHMRTTLDLPTPLLEKAKRLARARRTTLRQLVAEGLQWVVEADKASRASPSFRLRDASFGEGGLANGLDENDWERIRELTYEGRGS